MKYLLYLKRSLTRRTKQHISLFVILTCAFILPLLISIYRDSSAYGWKMFLLDLSKGETFHILNATEEDAEPFKNIDGLSEPRFDDGVVYLHILSDEEWKDSWTFDDYGMKLQKIADERELSTLYIVEYDYDTAHGIGSSDTVSNQRFLLIINIGMIFLSSFIIGSAYKSHIKRFSSDMAILRSCGADNKQIFTIFFVEFAVIFAIAALLAVGISAGIMKLLFMSYLQIDHSEMLAWVIFRIDPGNTLLHIAMFFVVLTFVITRTLIKFNKQSTANSIRSDIQTIELKRVPKKPFARKSPEKTLSSLWLQRTNKTHRNCLLVAVPIMSVFLFLFAYLSLDADYISSSSEYELWIFKEPQFGGFYQEDLDFIKSLDQVEKIRASQDATDECFDLESGGLMIDKIEIKLTDPKLHAEVETLLNERFAGVEYRILNFQATADEGAEISKGIYLMLAFIFAAMFLFVLVIICMKLLDYISDSKKTVRTLSTLGASDKTIEASYVRQSLLAAVLAAVLPAVISVILYIPATASVVQETTIDIWLILGYLTVSLLTGLAFILPVRHSLKGVLGGKTNEQNRS